MLVTTFPWDVRCITVRCTMNRTASCCAMVDGQAPPHHYVQYVTYSTMGLMGPNAVRRARGRGPIRRSGPSGAVWSTQALRSPMSVWFAN